MDYRIIFHPTAQSELDQLYDDIADAASAVTAWNYVGGIEAYCKGLTTFPKRGTERVDILRGLRVVGYRRSVSIAFVVEEDVVLILGVFHGGREITAEILEERL